MFFATVLCYPASAAFATAGWDRHDAQVATFRIHGANGSSFVHRMNGNGATSEPALCSNLDVGAVHIGLGCPPDYAVTDTHLAIRYPIATATPPPNHFLIRIDDGRVTGPMTAVEFKELPVVSSIKLDWKTPPTALDKFDWCVKVLLACVVVLLLGSALAIIRWARVCRSWRNVANRADVASPGA